MQYKTADASQALEEIRGLAGQRAQAAGILDHAISAIADRIREAYAAGVPAVDLASASGLSRARIYQIITPTS